MAEWFKAAAAVAVLAAVPARAQEHDGQLWQSATATQALSARLDVTMEAHTRLTDDVSRLGQLLLRPSVTVKLPDGFTATAGYAYVRTDFRSGRPNEEHRGWQQLGYRFFERSGVRLTGRSRLEQRFRVGAADDIGWRWRQQVRLHAPLQSGGKVAALVWNETFVQLNATRWGARSGIDQIRTFVGASVPLAGQVAVEPGYLNQTVFRTGSDRVNHVGLVALVARL